MKLKINNIEFLQKKFMVGRLFFKAYFDLDESLGNVYSAIYMIQDNPTSPVGFEFEGGNLSVPKLKNGKKLDDVGRAARHGIMRRGPGTGFGKQIDHRGGFFRVDGLHRKRFEFLNSTSPKLL